MFDTSGMSAVVDERNMLRLASLLNCSDRSGIPDNDRCTLCRLNGSPMTRPRCCWDFSAVPDVSMLCRFHTFTYGLVGSLARGRASKFFYGAVFLRYERRGEEFCDVPRVRNVGA